MQMLVRSKLGFEPIQNRSGLKRRPRRVLSVLRLHSPSHPSTRPSIRPRGCPLSSPATRRTRVRLYAKEKEKKKTSSEVSGDSVAGPNNSTSTSKTTNRPLQGFTSTREHLLNQLTLFTKERTRLGTQELYLQRRMSGTPSPSWGGPWGPSVLGGRLKTSARRRRSRNFLVFFPPFFLPVRSLSNQQ